MIPYVYATPALASNTGYSFKELLDFLLPDRRQRVLSFTQQDDRLRALWGELLSRSVISENLGQSYRNKNYELNECGKPFLQTQQNFYFNVSHCGEWVFCISAHSNCGIDCEKIKPINPKMGRRYFSAEEADYIESLDKSQRAWAFFRIWTLKESYLKMLGIGLTRGMKFFSILPGENNDFLTRGLEGEPLIQNVLWKNEYILSYVAAEYEPIHPPEIREQKKIIEWLS